MLRFRRGPGAMSRRDGPPGGPHPRSTRSCRGDGPHRRHGCVHAESGGGPSHGRSFTCVGSRFGLSSVFCSCIPWIVSTGRLSGSARPAFSRLAPPRSSPGGDCRRQPLRMPDAFVAAGDWATETRSVLLANARLAFAAARACAPGSSPARWLSPHRDWVSPTSDQYAVLGCLCGSAALQCVDLPKIAPLFSRFRDLHLEPHCQLLGIRIQLARANPFGITRLIYACCQVLLNAIASQTCTPCDLANGHVLAQCSAPDDTQCRHVYHSSLLLPL